MSASCTQEEDREQQVQYEVCVESYAIEEVQEPTLWEIEVEVSAQATESEIDPVRLVTVRSLQRPFMNEGQENMKLHDPETMASILNKQKKHLKLGKKVHLCMPQPYVIMRQVRSLPHLPK